MNMIEKAARAIAGVAILDENPHVSLEELDALVDARWSDYNTEAMSAISAIREPNDEMLHAGEGGGDAGTIYKRMIDKALDFDIAF